MLLVADGQKGLGDMSGAGDDGADQQFGVSADDTDGHRQKNKIEPKNEQRLQGRRGMLNFFQIK